MAKGDAFFQKSMYREAIPLYNEVLKSGSSIEKITAMTKIAGCYNLLGEFAESENWYQRAYLSDKRNPVSQKNYAIALKSSYKFKEAIEELNKYADKNPDDESVKNLIKGCQLAQIWFEEVPAHSLPKLMNFNSKGGDFAPVYYDKGIVFCSSKEGNMIKSGFRNYLCDFYYVNFESTGTNALAATPMKDLNSFDAAGTATFSSDGNKMFYTVLLPKRKEKGLIIESNLQIWYREKDSKGKWSEPRNILPFNSNSYSVAQPCLSEDGTKLYFTSDMQGGVGGADIWVSTFKNNEWSMPVNPGEPINTPGNELFPFIYNDSILYFSSDYLPGMGRLDVFESKFLNNKWQAPVNLKPPINTPGDDFGFIRDKKLHAGFYTSDGFGDNKTGLDDIYSYYDNEPLLLTLKGTNLIIPDRSFYDERFFSIKNNELKSDYSMQSSEGILSTYLTPSVKYNILVRDLSQKLKNKISIDLDNDSSLFSKSINISALNEPIRVTGNLIVKKDNDSVESTILGAKVKLILDNRIIEEKISDVKGYYKFDSLLNVNKNYKIVTSGGKLYNEFNLVNCKGLVLSNGKALANTEIQIKKNNVFVSGIKTNENGEYNIPLERKNIYAFSTSVKDTFIINETLTINLNPDTVHSPFIHNIELKRIQNTILCKGNLDNNGNALKNAKILLKQNNDILDQTVSGNSGEYSFKVKPGTNYIITASAEGMLEKSIVITTEDRKDGDVIFANIQLTGLPVSDTNKIVKSTKPVPDTSKTVYATKNVSDTGKTKLIENHVSDLNKINVSEKTLKQDLVLKGKIINSGHELPKSNVKLMLEGSVIQEMRTDTGGNFV
ncbi:MAG: hypothetical protein Q8880_08510, partial [Bacteroidota bacterium]|nr:hypothetical protein [Bacteroidota bacterium]